MKIAFITSSYPRFPGDGTAPFIMSIAEHFARFGHDVEVVAPYDVAARPMPSSGVKVHRFRYVWPDSWHIMGHARSLREDVRLRPSAFLLLPFFLTASLITLWRVTGAQKTQLIYAHWAIPNGLPAAIVARVRHLPLVISLHGSDMFVARRNPLFRAVTRWIFKGTTAVTACSPDLRGTAMSPGAPASTTLLAWGADPTTFKPSLRSGDVRRSLAASPGTVLVAFLGRLVPKKGVEVLLRALPPVLANHPQAKVVIAGDGPCMAELVALAKELKIDDRVTFPGRVSWERAPAFHAAADIFVQPSVRDLQGNQDGLPTVLLEAMSSGTAVVASRLGGIPLVIDDNANGLLVPPGNVVALSEALDRLVTDESERHRLGMGARASVERSFNWRSVALKLEAMFVEAIDSQRQIATPRMGSVYRLEIMRELGLDEVYGRVLDVGCHDGFLLGHLRAPQRIGIDRELPQKRTGLRLVRADGCFIPFADAAFDFVFVMDVIEHVGDDRTFAKSLLRVLAPGGRLILSTPGAAFRITPAFLTAWVSRKWGHDLRSGYHERDLFKMFEQEDVEVKIHMWNAPAWRSLYLLLRTLYPFSHRLIGGWLRSVAHWDSRHPDGKHGYQLLEARRSEPAQLSDGSTRIDVPDA